MKDIKQRDVSYSRTQSLTYGEMERMTYSELERKYYIKNNPRPVELRLVEPIKDVRL